MPNKRFDDDEDRPLRRKPARGSKRKAKAVRKRIPPIAIVAAAAAGFTLFAIIGAIIYFSTRDPGKPPSLDLMAHAPVDAILIGGYDLDEVSKHEGCRKALGRRAPIDLVQLEKAGYPTADLSRVLIARTANNGATCALRFKADTNAARYLKPAPSGRNYSETVNSEGIYRFGYFADAQTLVLAEKEPAIQALREKGKGKISGELQRQVDLVRGPVWVACGKISAEAATRLTLTEEGFTFRVGAYNGAAIWMVPDGKSAKVQMVIECESPARAKSMSEQLKSLFKVERDYHDKTTREGADSSDSPDVIRGYDGADISANGSAVSAKLTLPAGEAFWAVGPVRY